MNTTLNQLKVQLREVADKHQAINDYYWGSFLSAYKDSEVTYPLMGVYVVPTANFNENLARVELIIYVCDLVYADESNKDDTESDTLKVCKDVFNTLAYSERWENILRVESTTVNNFFERGGDNVCGQAMKVSASLKDNRSICDLPMRGYDFEAQRTKMCEDATYIVQYDNGTIIEQGTVPSGGSVTVEVDDPIVCQDATWQLLDSDGTVLDSGSIASGGSATISAPDATNEIYDTDSNLLYTETIPSGDTASTTIQNTEIFINSDPTYSILAEGVKNIGVINSNNDEVGTVVGDNVEIADSQAVQKDTNGVVLSTTPIAAEGSEDIVAPDATSTPTDSNGTILYTDSIPAEDSFARAITDGDIQFNGTSYFSILAQGVKNIIPKDLEGNVLAVNGTTGNDLNLNIVKGSTAPLMETGQTTSYATGDDGDIQAGRDFFTLQLAIDVITLGVLSGGNWAGNTNRFTDTDGAQVYANDIVLDWSTYNALTGNVLGYYRDTEIFGNQTWATQISSANGFTTSGYSNWRLTNLNESLNVLNHKNDGNRRLDYPPFNNPSGAWWCSTSADSNEAFVVRGADFNDLVTLNAKTGTTRLLMVRTFNISEL